MILAAFATIYFIWGSTYLFIGIAVETIPPHIMAGVRFIIAGTVLFTFLRLRGDPLPTRLHWRSALIIGVLLLAGGNGSVSWAELYVPTGLAALVIAVVPLLMVVMDWLRPGGTRPRLGVLVGAVLGLLGMFLLVGPSLMGVRQEYHPFGVGLLLFASISWSVGSIYSRHAPMPKSPLMMTASEMLTGGVVLWLMAVLLGEWNSFDPAGVSIKSLFALAYLTILGSLVAFSAYVFLLQVSTPAWVSNYAFVNPVVAVILGSLVNGERLAPLTLASSVVIITAVAIITYYQTRPTPQRVSAPSGAKLPE